MSEELVGSVSLEEPAAVVGPGQPVVETPAPVGEAPAAAIEDPEPEGTITTPAGKVVPLAALQAERGKRKDAESKLLPDADLQALRDKAARYDQTAAYVQQAQPIIEAIRSRPDLVQLAKQPATPSPVAAGPLSEQEAVEYAKDFDLYTTDGKPDVDRAQRIAKRNADINARQMQQTVAPLVQNEAQRVSAALYQRYLQTPETNGFKIDARYLAEAWNTVPPEMIAANPQVGEVLFRTALANQVLAGHKPTTVVTTPVVPTESVGGGRPAEGVLTAIDEKFLGASGMKRADFQSTANAYKAGQSNSLE